MHLCGAVRPALDAQLFLAGYSLILFRCGGSRMVVLEV